MGAMQAEIEADLLRLERDLLLKHSARHLARQVLQVGPGQGTTRRVSCGHDVLFLAARFMLTLLSRLALVGAGKL
eukprot:3941539-Rhodomonas_salina.2